MNPHELAKEQALDWIEELFATEEPVLTNATTADEFLTEMPEELQLTAPADGEPAVVREPSAQERLESARHEWELSLDDGAVAARSEEKVAADLADTMLGEPIDEAGEHDVDAHIDEPHSASTSSHIDRDLDVRIDAMLLVFRRRIDNLIADLHRD